MVRFIEIILDVTEVRTCCVLWFPVFGVLSLSPEVSTDDDIKGRAVIVVLWCLWVVVVCLKCLLFKAVDFLTREGDNEDAF